MEQPQHRHQTAALAALQLLSTTQKMIAELLSDPELAGIKNKIINGITRNCTALQSITGTFLDRPTDNTIHDIMKGFEPLQSVGGVKLNRTTAPVLEEQLHLSDTAKDNFRRKVNELFDLFPEMPLDAIYKRMKEPQGETIVRAVLKRAGAPDYKEVVIDDAVIENAQNLILDKRGVERVVELATGTQGIASQGGQQQEDDADDDGLGGGDSALPAYLKAQLEAAKPPTQAPPVNP